MLRLSINPDGYGEAALRGEVQSGSFTGEGEAWFTLKDIELFGGKLIEVSEFVAPNAELTGGVIGDAGVVQLSIYKQIDVSMYRLFDGSNRFT